MAYDGYSKAKPYAMPILRRIEAFLTRLLLILQTQRRQYVDPHVTKIWEKVKELSSGTPNEVHPTPTTFIPDPASTISTFTESVFEFVAPSHTTAAQTLADTPPDFSATVVSDPTPSSEQETVAADITASMNTARESPIASEDLEASSSSAGHGLEDSIDFPPSTSSESEAPAETVSPNLVLETLESASSIIAASIHDLPTASPAISSLADEVSSSVASAAATLVAQEEKDDIRLILDSFVADLGLDDDLPQGSESEDDATTYTSSAEAEEAEAERLRRRAEETAKKRANIMGRHTEWEAQLEVAIRDKQEELRKTLVTLRKAAVIELSESETISEQVELLVQEAEKYLKGAEVYLDNLRKEAMRDDKLSLWNKVMSKVEEKFSEKMRETEAVVNEWYTGLLQQEIQEVRFSDYHNLCLRVFIHLLQVRVAVVFIRELAERAQADMGLDYAWLDDVTYADWQRYHGLVKSKIFSVDQPSTFMLILITSGSEQFANQALSIQNGTHPSPPINPVQPALQDLQSEVQDVVLGFYTRLRRIKRTGERAFGPSHDGDATDNESAPELEPEILPDSNTGDPADVKEQNMPPVILSRSKEEISEALGKVGAEGADATQLHDLGAKDSADSMVREPAV
jgi:hypothetical protein